MNTQSVILAMMSAARYAGDFLLKSLSEVKKSDVQSKGLNDFVTFADKGAEKIIIAELSKIIPNSSFIAEESGVTYNDSEWTWIIDPLDGTTNYIHHIPLFCVSIALMKNKSLFAGVIFDPNKNEMFHAVSGEGAFLNGDAIKVSNTDALKDSIWATGFPSGKIENMDKYLNYISYSMQHTHGFRRLGSAALDLAYVAAARVDGYFKRGLKPWDMAAGALLVQEAGGVCKNFDNSDDFLFNNEIIACNKLIFTEFYSSFKTAF